MRQKHRGLFGQNNTDPTARVGSCKPAQSHGLRWLLSPPPCSREWHSSTETAPCPTPVNGIVPDPIGLLHNPLSPSPAPRGDARAPLSPPPPVPAIFNGKIYDCYRSQKKLRHQENADELDDLKRRNAEYHGITRKTSSMFIINLHQNAHAAVVLFGSIVSLVVIYQNT
jgi:hypothetical protein